MTLEPDDNGTRPFSFGTKPEAPQTEGTTSPTLPLPAEPVDGTRVLESAPETVASWPPISKPDSEETALKETSPETAVGWKPPVHFPYDETHPLDSPAAGASPRGQAPRPVPMPEGRSGALWDTIEASGEFQPGQVVFGRYIVQQKLGRGGMGTVWLVTHRELNTDRALKLIVAGITYDGQARARFRREAQVMAQFIHPNAVIVHDARLTENDVAYIDMEFVQGQSLDRIVKRGEPMPLPWIARVLDQLCDVLDLAHQKGIVHRDLKPANMMLQGDRPFGKEHLKVLDFGIAKILGDVETQGPQTMTGVFMGTPPYASPEQADGKADIRSDIYSVGVILYEFLTGFRPFSGPAARVLVDTITQPPPSFATINPAVTPPPGLEAIVMRCLAKNPDDRPQTAREVAESFRAALPREIGAELDKSSAQIEIVTRPFPWITVLLGLALIAFAGVMAGKYLPRSNDNRGPIKTTTGPDLVSTKTPLLPVGFEPAPKSEMDKLNRPSALVPVGAASSLGIKLITIPGGTFQMGEPKSAHKQVVPDFAMSETEVTNGQMHAYFKARKLEPSKIFDEAFQKLVAGSKGVSEPLSVDEAELHPAVGISRTTALDFARWLNAGLPTEAQWEYAARSRGLEKRPYTWRDPTRIGHDSTRANIDSEVSVPTAATKVRNYPDDCTVQGIFDLVGNVREWCRDSGNTPIQFVVRGGSWKTSAPEYSNYKGDFQDETETLNDLGFRIVVEWPKSQTPRLQ
ncbi:MAG: serine/threonine protein kinase [Planctomycetota bacterium]|nr:serine/threonine protein kinase [Planctomycetota bacterium]